MIPTLRSTTLGFLGAMWRWWVGELYGCLPQQVRYRLWRLRPRLVLAIDADETALLVAETGDKSMLLGRFDLRNPSDGNALSLRLQAKPFTARLPPTTALRSIITLPLAAKHRLADAIAFDLPRRVPFPVAETRHAYRLLNRDRASSRLVIELTVVQRSVIAALLAPLSRLQLTPKTVEIQPGGVFTTPSPNLITGSGPRAWQQWLPGGLAAFALLLGLTALVLPLILAHRNLDTLATMIGDEKRSADEAIRLQQEIGIEIQEAGFLSSRKHDSVSPTKLLVALTTILPDNTWLNELQLTSNSMVISGVTASSSALIALIDGAGAFEKPSFRSPVVQDPKSGNEQFTIASELRSEEAP